MMGEEKLYNWFLIMVSWEKDADAEAIQRFHHVYKYLSVFTPPEKAKEALTGLHPDDPRLGIVPESLKALNLIGRRKFVIICQALSTMVLQELSKIISLGAPISVEIFPATHVNALLKILPPPRQLVPEPKKRETRLR